MNCKPRTLKPQTTSKNDFSWPIFPLHPHLSPRAVVSSELRQPILAPPGAAWGGNIVGWVALRGGYEPGFTEAAAAKTQLYLKAIWTSSNLGSSLQNGTWAFPLFFLTLLFWRSFTSRGIDGSTCRSWISAMDGCRSRIWPWLPSGLRCPRIFLLRGVN